MRRALILLGAAAAVGAAAGGARAAAPSSTAAPTVSGTARVGETLSASNGAWANAPSSYTYQWQRCNLAGGGCADILAAADKQGYTLTSADEGHRVRVEVTAANADGRASAASDPTEVVSAEKGPTAGTRPTVTGTPAIGETLTAHPGSWTGASGPFRYRWLRCDPGDAWHCTAIAGAAGSTYGVRAADAGKQLRVVVHAATSGSQDAWVTSRPTATVPGATTSTTTETTTTIVTTTVAGNRAPSIRFLSLKRVHNRVYARVRVCDDRPGRLMLTERDNKARALQYTRRWRVPIGSCAVYGRSWVPVKRFRTKGRYVVTFRAEDASGRLSRLVSRSLVRR
jgi:hypothetical protein